MSTNETINRSLKDETSAVAFTAEDFLRRAKARLGFEIPASMTDRKALPPMGDFYLNRLDPEIFAEFPLVTAAVLVAVVDRAEPTILLTQRTQHLRSHAGQIAFPGGKIDPEDTSPRDAALREAEEEIGLDRRLVESIGYLDVYPTRYGVRVLPLLARVQPGFALRISPDEVEEAFEVPLAFLMDPANHRIDKRILNGAERSFYAMSFGDRYIWGATAGMLRALYERIYLR